MSLKINIYKSFFIALFFSAMFIGSIRLPIGPIRLDLMISFLFIIYLLIYCKPINKKILKNLIPFTFFILYFLFYIFIIADGIQLRDVLYIVMPIYTIISYFTLSVIINKINNLFLYKCFTIFIVTNFIFLIMQYTNLFHTNSLLSPYYEFLSINNAVDSKIATLTSRPFGLTGNPTYLTFLIYLFYKICLKIKKTKLISFLAIITMLISCGRMILFFAICWEIIEYIIKKIINVKNPKFLLKKILNILFFIIILLICVIACIYFIPFMHQEIWNGIVEGWLFQSDSYTYRTQMLNFIKDIGWKSIFLGGMTYHNLSNKLNVAYFDSEYIMRILQFGVVGLYLLFYPLIDYAKKNKFELFSIFILAICLTFAMTQFTITNYAFIFYIVLYLAVMDKIYRGVKINGQR